MIKIANHLTILRKKEGFKTAKEAAMALGISVGMLYQMEQNLKQPSVKLAIRMMELYKCKMEDIFLVKNITKSDKFSACEYERQFECDNEC